MQLIGQKDNEKKHQKDDDGKPALQQMVRRGHLYLESDNNNEAIPAPVAVSPALPEPEQAKKEATHTVIVSNVPVHELLFSLARDAKLNLDIDPDVKGKVTLNAIDQPLPALLDRISESTNLTYILKNKVLRVKVDRPYLQNYRIDYINMNRSSLSSVTVSTQISSTGQGGGEEDEASSGEGNNSATEVNNSTDNTFWTTLHRNISAIISEGDMMSQEGETESNPNIIMNRETGILGVRATRKQHKEIDEFINEVTFSSRRQVLIEATIAEITLSDGFQAGVDWQYIDNQLSLSPTNISQTLTDIALFDRPTFTIDHSNNDNGDSIKTTLSALQTFGEVSIMSSPKVMALNNQTALLKVVDNLVYFTVDVNIETTSSSNDNDGIGFVTYETEIQTVPVGFVMSVTPYISESDLVTLNIRPTISRVIGQARDPNPALADVGVISEVPVIQVREVESVLKVGSGDIAVMGGLMQDETTDQNNGVPFISKIPFIGSLFRHQDNLTKKTELVIFIRPTVIKNASLNADLKPFKDYLPRQ